MYKLVSSSRQPARCKDSCFHDCLFESLWFVRSSDLSKVAVCCLTAMIFNHPETSFLPAKSRLRLPAFHFNAPYIESAARRHEVVGVCLLLWTTHSALSPVTPKSTRSPSTRVGVLGDKILARSRTVYVSTADPASGLRRVIFLEVAAGAQLGMSYEQAPNHHQVGPAIKTAHKRTALPSIMVSLRNCSSAGGLHTMDSSGNNGLALVGGLGLSNDIVPDSFLIASRAHVSIKPSDRGCIVYSAFPTPGQFTTLITKSTALVRRFPDINFAAARQAATSATQTKMQMLEKLNDLDLKSFPLEFDESPTSAVTTLPQLTTPLPPAEDTSWIAYQPSDWILEREAIQPPAAPVMKDLDSFTEGTGKGSFESVIDEAAGDGGDLFNHPDDTNFAALGLLPELDPSLSHAIEMWREEVSGYGLGAPNPGIADLPEDPIEREAIDAAESLLDVINLGSEELEDVVNDPPRRPLYHISLSSAPLTATTPRVMKRARSRSPTSQCSRRIRRARSKSLSSICLSTELTKVPPWRAKNDREKFMPPFD
ncbi:hypothetical protein LshimejAT787_1101950 [Lyophyllum shimeji]|uniref:Uncharacterized protein n=1 Tax=Lyophyllum shimeji TaxID=47721 RepID=A0A9P3PSW0_LYOSH|nr:hypothetical protein LshimejAT787_1101950 [Lyophyllum shimeji]